MEQQDQILVNHFLETRSENSFRELYRSKTPRLYMLALRLTGQDVVKSEELIQEMWVRAIRKLPSFQWKSTILTWLTGILINLNKEKFREQVRDKVLEDLKFHQPDLVSQSPIDIMDLEKAIESLPQGYRQILVLHDIEGYKHREIAEMLDIEEGTSKSQLFQARKAIRKYLSDK